MSPDLLYFLMASTVYRGVSHSWAGLFLFCLPAGIIFSFAFHWLFKYHFIINLPRPYDRYLSGLAVSKWQVKTTRQWVILVLSILIGTLSHFGWDSFTHTGGEIASRYTFLTEQVMIEGHRFHLAEILQHLSTIFGAFVIIYFALKGWLLPPETELPERRKPFDKLFFWTGCLIISLLFIVVIVYTYQHFYPWLIPHLIITLGLASWAGLFWAVAGYSVLKKLFFRIPVPKDRV